MNVHADAIQAAQFAGTPGNHVLAAKRPAQQHLTMRWQLRGGVLVQVWRTTAGAANLWPDAGAAPRLAA
jgi:hypothetical protein